MSETENSARPHLIIAERGAGQRLIPHLLRRRTSALDGVIGRRNAAQAVRTTPTLGTENPHRGSAHGPSSTQPLSIIVVDDDADQVDLTVMLLQTRGHHVIGSIDGSRGVELVAGEKASVIVLDFMLNRMTGGDVCDALRAESRTRNVRIVLLSGTSEVEIRRTCTQYDIYLRKPTTGKALFKAVELAIDP